MLVSERPHTSQRMPSEPVNAAGVGTLSPAEVKAYPLAASCGVRCIGRRHAGTPPTLICNRRFEQSMADMPAVGGMGSWACTGLAPLGGQATRSAAR